MNARYERILNVKKPPSEKHPQMPLYERAAQFAPFAALTGFDSSVRERARLTERQIELDDYEIEQLDMKLRIIAEAEGQIGAKITYFIEDSKKNGGKYVTKEGRVVKIDDYEKKLLLDDGTFIEIEKIINIEV